jgi:hypothetical protein
MGRARAKWAWAPSSVAWLAAIRPSDPVDLVGEETPCMQVVGQSIWVGSAS